MAKTYQDIKMNAQMYCPACIKTTKHVLQGKTFVCNPCLVNCQRDGCDNPKTNRSTGLCDDCMACPNCTRSNSKKSHICETCGVQLPKKVADNVCNVCTFENELVAVECGMCTAPLRVAGQGRPVMVREAVRAEHRPNARPSLRPVRPSGCMEKKIVAHKIRLSRDLEARRVAEARGGSVAEVRRVAEAREKSDVEARRVAEAKEKSVAEAKRPENLPIDPSFLKFLVARITAQTPGATELSPAQKVIFDGSVKNFIASDVRTLLFETIAKDGSSVLGIPNDEVRAKLVATRVKAFLATNKDTFAGLMKERLGAFSCPTAKIDAAFEDLFDD